jgi:Leucine-rich repeat (LRR) protein
VQHKLCPFTNRQNQSSQKNLDLTAFVSKLPVDLRLNSNALTGPIPDIFTSLPNLRNLLLGNNELEGSIPTSIGRLQNLVALQLFENKLIGTIPTILSKLIELVHLDLNALTGIIPILTTLVANSPFQELRLDGNKLKGSIPIDLCDLTNLKLLTLNDNQLTGIIPHEIGRLENLEVLQLYHNSLAGNVPVSVCLLKSDFKLKWLPVKCTDDAIDVQCTCCDSC